MDTTALDKIDLLLDKATRLAGLIRWIFTLLIAGVLFVARTEWNHADHEKRIASTEADGKKLMIDVSRIKGSLGVAKVNHLHPESEPTESVVWSEDEKSQTR